MFPILISALRETLFMVGPSCLIAVLIGLPLGLLLATIQNSPYKLINALYYMFVLAVQLVKSTPYLMIMLLCLPLSNLLISYNISYLFSTIIPLSIVGSILLAEKVHTIISALFVKWGPTAKTMGANKRQTLFLILLPEGLADIYAACFNVFSLIIVFSTIAGALGAGGLGQLAIEKSITDPQPLYVLACIGILVAFQQIIYYTGSFVNPQRQPR